MQLLEISMPCFVLIYADTWRM